MPHRWRLVIPGNHEFFLEADPFKRNLISNAIVLINEEVDIMGLKIWGSPTTPLYGGAFGLSPAADRTSLYEKVPKDVDILVTHGPPHGILDRHTADANHAGCPQLLDAVTRLKPKLHVFGHVHGAHGLEISGETLFVNAALIGLDDDLSESAIVLRMPHV